MVNLILGNCLVELKKIDTGSIDLVFTDPPYNISRSSKIEQQNFRNPQLKKLSKLKKDFGEWDKFTEEEFYKFTEEWVSECCRVLKKNGVLISYFDRLKLNILVEITKKFNFKTFCPFCWVKTNPPPQVIRQPSSGWEAGLIACRPRYTFNKDGFFSNYFIEPLIQGKNRYNHPTQKPIKQTKRLIEKYSNENETILDPFMGTGTTGVGAVELNRNFIGIELKEEYFEIAKKRIEKSQFQEKLSFQEVLD